MPQPVLPLAQGELIGCPITVQSRFAPGEPSSVEPSQLSSRPLQTSIFVPGMTVGTHDSLPPEHVCVPAAQMPLSIVSQDIPVMSMNGGLSIMPSQLLSLPSHDSAAAMTFWIHLIMPPMQWVVPALHSPSLPVSQSTPPPGSPSSIIALQLSSRPLQVSVFLVQSPPAPALPAEPPVAPPEPPAVLPAEPLEPALLPPEPPVAPPEPPAVPPVVPADPPLPPPEPPVAPPEPAVPALPALPPPVPAAPLFPADPPLLLVPPVVPPAALPPEPAVPPPAPCWSPPPAVCVSLSDPPDAQDATPAPSDNVMPPSTTDRRSPISPNRRSLMGRTPWWDG